MQRQAAKNSKQSVTATYIGGRAVRHGNVAFKSARFVYNHRRARLTAAVTFASKRRAWEPRRHNHAPPPTSTCVRPNIAEPVVTPSNRRRSR